jgi:hypothetical protein
MPAIPALQPNCSGYFGLCADRAAATGLLLEAADFVGFSFFGFFGSRPLRFCPFAMVVLPAAIVGTRC